MNCVYCGSLLPDKGRSGPAKKQCSNKCAEKWKYRLKVGWAEKSCVICGHQFMATPGKKFCSSGCRALGYRVRLDAKRKRMACPSCGALFITLRGRLCRACRPSNTRAMIAANLADVRQTCLDCGLEFTPKEKRQTCCTKECSSRRWSRKKRGDRKGQFVEDVEMAVLYARDSGICQLCGGPVSLEYKGKHPLAPTIDHIFPTSKGGQHSYANTQLAHYRCNSKKGAKV